MRLAPLPVLIELIWPALPGTGLLPVNEIVALGLLNCGWLKALNESARASKCTRSLIPKVLLKLRSVSTCLGPRKMFLPESPNPLADAVNAERSNHSPCGPTVGCDNFPLPTRLGLGPKPQEQLNDPS